MLVKEQISEWLLKEDNGLLASCLVKIVIALKNFNTTFNQDTMTKDDLVDVMEKVIKSLADELVSLNYLQLSSFQTDETITKILRQL